MLQTLISFGEKEEAVWACKTLNMLWRNTFFMPIIFIELEEKIIYLEKKLSQETRPNSHVLPFLSHFCGNIFTFRFSATTSMFIRYYLQLTPLHFSSQDTRNWPKYHCQTQLLITPYYTINFSIPFLHHWQQAPSQGLWAPAILTHSLYAGSQKKLPLSIEQLFYLMSFLL